MFEVTAEAGGRKRKQITKTSFLVHERRAKIFLIFQGRLAFIEFKVRNTKNNFNDNMCGCLFRM